MNLKSAYLTATLFLAASTIVRAEEWVDYAPGTSPWTVTTVKVGPGKMDDYLVGLKKSLTPALEIQKRNGEILDYHILVSVNENAPGANVVFLVKFKDWSVLAPNKDRDLKLTEEIRKTFSKETETKTMDDRAKFRTFLDEGTFADITYLK